MRWSRSQSRTTKPLAPVLLLVLVGLVVAAPPAAAAAAVPGGPWVSPLAGPLAVSRAFDPPDTPYGSGHRGVDLAAATGADVRAAGAGTVSYATLLAGRGVVVVVHGELRTTYEPVTAVVEVGQQVAAGEVIGALDAGHASCAPATCLHWGLRRGDTYLDPLRLLRRAPSVLLPLTPADRALPGTASRRGATGLPAPGLAPEGRPLAGAPAPGLLAPDARPVASRPAADRADAPAEAREEPRWALRAADLPLGGAALLALVAGLGLIVRPATRPRPSPPAAPLSPAGHAGPAATAPAAPAAPLLLAPLTDPGLTDTRPSDSAPPPAPLDLATERLRRRPA